MSRVISHLLRDIASLTRYHQDASSRLCFLLGARKAIQMMMAVKDAPEYTYLVLNQTGREKSMDQVKSKVEKEIQIQGYDFKARDDLGDIIAVKTTDRKEEIEQKIKDNPELADELVNRFETDQIKNEEIPTVVVRRNASIDASKGESILSGDILQMGNIQAQENVVIQNMHYDVVAHGIAEMSSEEIKRSPGRVAIRTLEGRYDEYRVAEQKRYRNGLYYVSTLPRILGMNLLKFKKSKKAYVLVVCQDNGETAVSIYKRAPEGSRIAILVRNEQHKEDIEKSIERLDAPIESFQLITQAIDRYAKTRPRNKFTHFFIEFPSSETGLRPNPFMDMEEKNIINFARTQFQGIRSLALIGENEAQIAFVSHSLDPTENQEIVIQSFRQGYFSPLVLEEEMKREYPLEINVLPEIPTISQGGAVDFDKLRAEESYQSCWLGVDPVKHKSHAGFVAYFELLLKQSTRR